MVSKLTYFFSRGHGRWSFIHSNPKSVFFFFSEITKKRGKKNTTCVFFFPGKVHKPFIPKWVILSWFFSKNEAKWYIKLGNMTFFLGVSYCFFFPKSVFFFCVFFFSWKSSHVIHSFNFWGGKKNTTPEKKKQLFHSFIRYSSKMPKNELFRVKKKYGTFAWSLSKRS